MRVQRTITVRMPADEAWSLLDNLPELAAQIPGLTVDHQGPQGFSGTLAVRLGPLNFDYTGRGRIIERDASERRALIVLEGSDPGGGRRVSSTVRLHMHPRVGDAGPTAEANGDRGASSSIDIDATVRFGPTLGDLGRQASSFGSQAVSRRIRMHTPPGHLAAGGMRLGFQQPGPGAPSEPAGAGSDDAAEAARDSDRESSRTTGSPGPSAGQAIRDFASTRTGAGLAGALAGAALAWRIARR
ncbi:MAG: hypothetical protein CSA58_02070 [Micrococcales bacterium]|nr:MAG: hypothetical protein CSB46_06370 [Micrococcales bacterium]PIE27847.1 MAG: hypothetical protein CSA58_02070 [Micrococcales bacterium]